MGLFQCSLPPPGLSPGTFASPTPQAQLQRVFRELGPTKDTHGNGVPPFTGGNHRDAAARRSCGLCCFIYLASPAASAALSPGRPGQPRPHRHAASPSGFSHSCGRRRHGNELIRGGVAAAQASPARPGPLCPCAQNDRCPRNAFLGQAVAVSSMVAQSRGAGAVNPWYAAAAGWYSPGNLTLPQGTSSGRGAPPAR